MTSIDVNFDPFWLQPCNPKFFISLKLPVLWLQMKGHYPNNKKLCIHLIEKHKKYINTTFNRGRRCEITGRRNGVRQDKFQNMWLGQDSTVQYIVLWYECPKWEWTYFWQVIDTPLCVHLNQISTCKTTLKENFTFEKFSRRFTREIASVSYINPRHPFFTWLLSPTAQHLQIFEDETKWKRTSHQKIFEWV